MERALYTGPELTIVVPTFNERDNIALLVEKLRATLKGVAWQVIFVDDNSPDGTADTVKALSICDSRLVCLRRVGRRGLAGAVVEGALASAAPFVAVMDADLQHDETLLPRMLETLRSDGADLVIGSRFLQADGLATGLSKVRKSGSRLANALARRVLKADVSDPVSGFFMMRRCLIDEAAPRLSNQGFKILFDIIASQPAPPRIVELPYAFANRATGASKMNGRIIIDYLGLILTKMTGNIVPQRALMFAVVGVTGVIVNLAVLYALKDLGVGFKVSQIVAAVIAMTSNFIINNVVTYRDRQLRGLKLITGYLRFCGLCGLGLIANVAVAILVHGYTPIWWLASVAGALFGAAWNFVSTSLAVW